MKYCLTILIIFFLLGCSTQQKYINGAFGYKFGQTLTESMIVLQDEKNFFKIYGTGKTYFTVKLIDSSEENLSIIDVGANHNNIIYKIRKATTIKDEKICKNLVQDKADFYLNKYPRLKRSNIYFDGIYLYTDSITLKINCIHQLYNPKSSSRMLNIEFIDSVYAPTSK